MKLIVDIPEERLNSIKHFGIKQNEVYMLEKSIINGIPLDKIRAEIEFEVDHRTNMLCTEDVFAILDKYKAESEGEE